MGKIRIDQLLVQNGLFSSREQAQRAIMAGLVRVNQERIDKTGTKVPENAVLEVKGQLHPYVSRGGLKLEEAIRVFGIDISGKVMLDIGASTGGFTDCALQHGVTQVYAIDVGYGQLAWKIRQDPRVIVMERTNFRYLNPEKLTGHRPNLATIDVSFISLAHILPNLKNLLLPDGMVLALIKPQFEAGREQVGKRGIVKDPTIHRDVLNRFVSQATAMGYHIVNLAISPIQGGEGNIEFLSYLIHTSREPSDWSLRIAKLVQEAHEKF